MIDPKIIEVLDSAIRKAHGEGWDYVDLSIEDAREILAALRRDEPRVMTVEEINKRAESLDPGPVFVQWRESGGTAWVTRSINIIAGMVNAGNRSVRAWTSRPSPEQMRNTPWEGEDNG